MKKLSRQSFIDKANKVHNYKYIYDSIKYINTRTKLEIICPLHGSFYQTPNSHCNGRGCIKCSIVAPLSEKDYLLRFRNKHGQKFDYSKSIFNGNHNKIIIICPIHGEFLQAPQQHFIQGCSACAGVKELNTEVFIKKAILVHGKNYDYSQTKYATRPNKIKIICSRHGKFFQTANAHLSGKGCLKCTTSISKKETKWLDILGIPNDNLHRNVIICLNDKRFNVDGYFGDAKIIYEFLGDYWHGNPSIYPADDFNKNNKKTFGELFNETKSKIKFLRQYGFKVICIWESKFDKVLK